MWMCFYKNYMTYLMRGGVLAITVPPLKQTIVGGHVNFFTPGLLLYRLVLAGFDCSDASVKAYDYDISVIVRKTKKTDISNIEYDCGDIRKLRRYFPKNIKFQSNDLDDPFDGNIHELNWK